jgi:hypothetical protein
MTSQVALGHSPASLVKICARDSIDGFAVLSASSRRRTLSVVFGITGSTASRSSCMTARISGVWRTRIQTPVRPRWDVHSRANVVFPYPAGATRRITRASASSISFVKRGRVMIWRCVGRSSGAVAVGFCVPSVIEVPRGRSSRLVSVTVLKFAVERGCPHPRTDPRVRAAVSPRARERARGVGRAGRSR